MTREEAILNAQMVMHYLAIYQRAAYTTLDITPHDVRIHYFNMTATDDEVQKVVKNMETFIRAEADIEYDRNEQLNQLTFNIIWQLWK